MAVSLQPFVAAVVQAAPEYLDLTRSVDKAVSLIGQAADAGVRLVAFPELWLPGYPWWLWLSAFGDDHRGVLEQRYREQAFKYGGAAAGRLVQAARDHHVVVAIGFAERDGDNLYIGQWLIDEAGATLAKRRKLKPGGPEHKLFGEGGARDLKVAATSLGRVGALCCAEHRSPLFKQALHEQGEDVHVAAWPSFAVEGFAAGLSPETYLSISRTYATEGGCYVLAPASPVTQEMRDLVCDTPAKREVLKLGGGYAQIFAPNGEPLCTPLAPTAEGLLTAVIDPGKIAAAKAAFDVAGHSSRPDVVRLACSQA